jgi:hypothetical protein
MGKWRISPVDSGETIKYKWYILGKAQRKSPFFALFSYFRIKKV